MQIELRTAHLDETAGAWLRALEHYRTAFRQAGGLAILANPRQDALAGMIRMESRAGLDADLIVLLRQEISIREAAGLTAGVDYVLYHRWIGESYDWLGMSSDADKYLHEAVSLARRHFVGDPVKAVDFEVEVGASHARVGREKDAMRVYTDIVAKCANGGREYDRVKERARRAIVEMLRHTGGRKVRRVVE